MKNGLKKIFPFFVLTLIAFSITQCTKENFIEPPDPFEPQKLDANPEVFSLGSGSNALTLKTNSENILKTDYGYKVKGSIFIENNKYGDIRLTNGDFELHQSEDGSYFNNLTGLGLAELPKEGILGDLVMTGIEACPFGFQKGSEFETGAFAWPVNNDRYYFYFENSEPLKALISGSELSNINKIAIDPLDPFFFVTCDIGETKIGELTDVGFAVSAQGLIPYYPAVNEYDIPNFEGQFYITGTIPLEKYPIALTGEAVVGFPNPQRESTNKFFSGAATAFNMGVNGRATLDNTVLDWLNLEITLGQTSLYLGVDENGDTRIKYAGLREFPPSEPLDFLKEVVGGDWEFVNYINPYESKELFYGTIGNKLDDWEFGFKIHSNLNLLGITLNSVDYTLELTPSSMYFDGKVVMAVFNTLRLKGYIEKTGRFIFEGSAAQRLSISKGRLKLKYELSMDAKLDFDPGRSSDKFIFTGKVKLSGKACVEIADHDFCAGFTIKASVTITSSGKFEVCFSIGIGKLGFDVCITYNPPSLGENPVMEQMRYEEIPLEMVPPENRFPIDCYDCY